MIRVKLDQPIEKGPPLIDVLHPVALVQTVEIASIGILEQAIDPIASGLAASLTS
jgi:hypothetical protein